MVDAVKMLEDGEFESQFIGLLSSFEDDTLSQRWAVLVVHIVLPEV